MSTSSLFIPVKKNAKYDWSNYTLIMPAVSVGNVGQLCADLLIFSLETEHIGYLYSRTILPLVGPDPFGRSSAPATSCQLYLSQSPKLVIIQQRTPVAKNRRREHCRLLAEWLKECSFKLVVLLSSSFSQYYPGAQEFPLKYLATSPVPEAALPSLPLMEKQHCHPVIPGAGLTRLILRSCEESSLPMVTLIYVTAEGNNIPDALNFATQLATWLNLPLV